MRLAPIVLAAFAWAAVGTAHAQTCARADFEAVVNDAAAALRVLTQESTPAFQEKLRALKEKRNWTHDQFLAEAAPLVQDDSIADFDQKSSELLARINSMGAEGSSASTPDCKLLAALNANMQSLVDTQRAKWAYMFAKVDQAMKR